MVALRTRSLAAFSGPFWLCAFSAAFAPTAIGYQDLTAFMAQQPGPSERPRDHMIASPFGTIHAATFRFARPIGTAMSEAAGVQPVNFDPRSLDVKVWSANEPSLTRPALHVEYPSVNRRLKGDRMPAPENSPAASGPESAPQSQPVSAPSSPTISPPVPIGVPRPKTAERLDDAPAELAAAEDAFGFLPAAAPQSDDATDNVQTSALPPRASETIANAGNTADAADDVALADKPPEIPAVGESDPPEAGSSPFASLSFLDDDAAERTTRLYFGVGSTSGRSALEQWAPGAEPMLVSPAVDPEIKLSALEEPADAGAGGETVAGKGDLTRLQSPAERLGLFGKPRAKAEKCLADAVYFEARGEPLRGQEAVAQVVMNRVFSGFYPDNVCGVVYQNANRHLACQFTFACEGKDLSRIDEPDMWEQAKRIAKDTLDGKTWLTDVGHATHYHAYWVHPSWVHEMKKMYKLGVHTFYRPRAWGDGSDAPAWGNVPAAATPPGAGAETPVSAKEPAAKSTDAARGPQAAASPEPAGKKTRTAKL
jgi:hypothetical protein